MTNITFRTQPAPSIPREIKQELEDMTPRVFLRWDPKYERVGSDKNGRPIWGGRWEIWCELRDVAHPEAENKLAEMDRWNPEAQCWMRKLQVYKARDGGYAPPDRALIIGLRMADAWQRDGFYEQNFDSLEEREQAVRDTLTEAIGGSARYTDKLDEPIVGPYTKGSWRHRIR